MSMGKYITFFVLAVILLIFLYGIIGTYRLGPNENEGLENF